MDNKKILALAATLLLIFGLTGASAQAFFPKRLIGTLEVRVTSQEPGVQLILDDQNAGTLPVVVYVLPGPHKLTFIVPGEQPKTITYPVTADVEVPFISAQRSFPLTVITNVPNAQLAVDGSPFPGNTTNIAPGNHTLTVSAPGYQAQSMPFVQQRRPNTINLTLVSELFPLTVNTNVPGAQLAVDGNPLDGNMTSESAGNHVLTVSAPGYQTVTLPFVQPEKPHYLNVNLVAMTGTLVIRVDQLFDTRTPYKVFINGKEIRRGPQILAPGNYNVRLVCDNFQSETMVTLAQGQTLTLSPMVQWNQQ